MSIKEMSDNTKERLRFFDEHYDPLEHISILQDERVLPLGEIEKRFCRFCGKGIPDTTFSDEAHALPELIGNKHLVSYYECDNCNKKFSKLEDQFGKFIKPWRTLTFISGKNGVPKYKTSDGLSRIEYLNKTLNIKTSNKNPIIKKDEKNKMWKVIQYRESYYPIAVFKCLVKMALTLIPEEELCFFEETLNWICKDSFIDDGHDLGNLICLFSFAPGIYTNNFIQAWLLKRKDDKAILPYVIFVLIFKNYFFQIYLPLSLKDCHLIGHNFKLPFFPTPLDDNCPYGKVRRKKFDLSSKECIKKEPVVMQIEWL